MTAFPNFRMMYAEVEHMPYDNLARKKSESGPRPLDKEAPKYAKALGNLSETIFGLGNSIVNGINQSQADMLNEYGSLLADAQKRANNPEMTEEQRREAKKEVVIYLKEIERLNHEHRKSGERMILVPMAGALLVAGLGVTLHYVTK